MRNSFALVLFVSVALSALLIAPAATWGQQKGPVPTGHPAVSGTGSRAPSMGSMMESLWTAWYEFLAKPETAAKMADFTKNYYDALVAKGFSKDEALKIVKAVGVPKMSR
jgi:hypothetical protein